MYVRYIQRSKEKSLILLYKKRVKNTLYISNVY